MDCARLKFIMISFIPTVCRDDNIWLLIDREVANLYKKNVKFKIFPQLPDVCNMHYYFNAYTEIRKKNLDERRSKMKFKTNAIINKCII